MLIINQYTTSKKVKAWIQDMLNRNYVQHIARFLDKNLQRSYDEELWNAVMQYQFDINDGTAGRIINGNTLLHLAVYVQVKKATLNNLLDIGVNHDAHRHTNSDGHILLKFASKLSQDFGGKYVQLLDYLLEGDNSATLPTEDHLQYLLHDAYNIGNPMVDRRNGKDGEVEYVVIADLLLCSDVGGYDLFDDACIVNREIKAFIDLAVRNHPELQEDKILFKTEGSKVTFISDNENTLRILFGEEGGSYEGGCGLAQ